MCGSGEVSLLPSGQRVCPGGDGEGWLQHLVRIFPGNGAIVGGASGGGVANQDAVGAVMAVDLWHWPLAP